MKNVIRAFVVVLAFTGAAASTQITSASASTHTKVLVSKTSAIPVPMCAPDDPDACGITEGR